MHPDPHQAKSRSKAPPARKAASGTEGTQALPRWLVVVLTAGAILLGGGAALWVAQLLFPEPEERAAQASARSRQPAPDAGPSVEEGVTAETAQEPGELSGAREFRRVPRLAKRTPRRRPPLTSVYDWPREPASPPELDAARFKEAFVRLCGPHAKADVGRWYADWILEYSQQFSTDPFLLGGLVMRESGCAEKGREGIGTAGLRSELYGPDVARGTYRYHRFDNGKFVAAELGLPLFPFEAKFVDAPQSNLYFAAAFLKAWREQYSGLRAAFVQRSEYRHYVSHYLWGDIVQSNRQEDWILVERRRLLEYYGAHKPMPPVNFRGFELGCPLDGCPRVITSTLGDAREGGKRSHRGVDFESTQGEPVLAIGDGVVVFVGVDLPGKGAHQRLPLYAQNSVEKGLMGVGGLYACIRHDLPKATASITSCYMHLEALEVAAGRRVKRGTLIGRVGRTGIKVSPPHLHFEIHAEDGIHAATEVLPGLVLGNPPVDVVPSHVLGFEPTEAPSDNP